MAQVHKSFSDDEVKQLFSWYESSSMTRTDVLNRLGIGRSRFYVLLNEFKKDPNNFSIAYRRKKPNHRLPDTIVARIRRELEADKRLIDNPNMPVMFYNYAHVRDNVVGATGYDKLSAQTVINYARKWGYYLERPKKQHPHTRQVITNYVGMLLQHDSSHHQWTPYAIDNKGQPIKWVLITTLDDHSRKILYAELFEKESAWAHIQALEAVTLEYGVGISYYSDNHSIFRYVADRDQQIHLDRILNTDDVPPQWKQCVESIGMKVQYAMSPEAKGKVERPYRWLQDRVVRLAAKTNARTIDQVRQILYQEVDRYNNRQVHSTTKEVPSNRFTRAITEGRSCFRPLNINKTNPPVESTKDIFCLRTERKVNGYGNISFLGDDLSVPGDHPDGTTIVLHIIPSTETTEVRLLKNNSVLGYTTIPTPPQFHF